MASKSERIQKKRKRNKLLLPLFYIVFGIVLLVYEKPKGGLIFIGIASLWYFMYPLWERRHFRNHYEGFIKENYKERLGRAATVVFNHDFIMAKDYSSESKISTTELKEISEISSAIFVHIKGGQTMILPKNKLSNVEEVKTNLKELASHLNIRYTIDETWEWK